MQLSIIIPTKDRQRVFDETLRWAIQAVETLDAEIIIVNDSKTSSPSIPTGSNKITLHQNPKSGVAAARNFGASKATAKLLLFLDDDVMISKQSLLHIFSIHEKNERVCLNVNWEYPPSLHKQLALSQFGRFLETHGMSSFKGWYADSSWKDHSLFASKSVASFHLSILKSDFEKTKGYSEHFPHAGFEDYDFPLQLKQAGLLFYIDSRVTVFHNEADRLQMSNWLNNQQRRAATRRVAVDLGYTELKLTYSTQKIILLNTIVALSTLFVAALKIIPNRTRFDGLYFKLVGALQAAQIYKGYTSHLSQ